MTLLISSFLAVFKLSYLAVVACDETLFGFANGIKVVFQEDGNFVAYKPGRVAVAATASNYDGPNLTLVFNEWSDLVVSSGGIAVWTTKTDGTLGHAELVIRDVTPYIQIVGKDGKILYTANEYSK